MASQRKHAAAAACRRRPILRQSASKRIQGTALIGAMARSIPMIEQNACSARDLRPAQLPLNEL
jgi:hypothetical protein